MKIQINFKDGTIQTKDFYTALDADRYVDTLKDVEYYEILKENENNDTNH